MMNKNGGSIPVKLLYKNSNKTSFSGLITNLVKELNLRSLLFLITVNYINLPLKRQHSFQLDTILVGGIPKPLKRRRTQEAL